MVFQKKKGVKEKGGMAVVVVVVGTGSGDVIAWDTALGELKWRASDCHAGYVISSVTRMSLTLKSNPFESILLRNAMCCSVRVLHLKNHKMVSPLLVRSFFP